MKKLLIISISALLVAGCNTTSVTMTDPKTGKVFSISNNRAVWHDDNYDWSFNTNGIWHASASNSGPDAATVQAVTQLLQTVLAAKP